MAPKVRNGYYTLSGIDPHTGKTWDIWAAIPQVEWWNKTGRTRQLAFCVNDVLTRPKAVFQGIRDLEHELSDDTWYCYLGQPDHWYPTGAGDVRRTWDDRRVLCVYVTEERELYLWYTAEVDVDYHRFLPPDHEARFGKRLI